MEFCGTGFKPVKKHGQDGRATLFDTKFRTAPEKCVDGVSCTGIGAAGQGQKNGLSDAFKLNYNPVWTIALFS
jgi:hypothetical protein